MIMNRRSLPRQPHERSNGEAAIRFYMQHVLPVISSVRFLLFRREQIIDLEKWRKQFSDDATDSPGTALCVYHAARCSN